MQRPDPTLHLLLGQSGWFLGKDQEKSVGVSIRGGGGEANSAVWFKPFIPLAYGEHVALFFLASENRHAGDAGS